MINGVIPKYSLGASSDHGIILIILIILFKSTPKLTGGGKLMRGSATTERLMLAGTLFSGSLFSLSVLSLPPTTPYNTPITPSPSLKLQVSFWQVVAVYLARAGIFFSVFVWGVCVCVPATSPR